MGPTASRPTAGLDRFRCDADQAAKAIIDGTHRVCSLEDTLARVDPHLATMGITRVADLTDLDTIGIPVVQAIRPNAKSLSVAQGKGLSLSAAQVSAVMEATEIWHAENLLLPLERTTAAGGQWPTSIDLDALPGAARDGVPKGLAIDWVKGTRLESGEACWVPSALVGMDETTPRDPLLDWIQVTTGGLASGNTHVEAIGHALYELIERDAWATATRKRWGPLGNRLDLDSLPATDRGMLDRCRDAGLQVVATDITNDLLVPTVLCELIEYPANPHRPAPVAAGLGCHLSPTVAFTRALTEAAQSRLTAIAGARDDMDCDPDDTTTPDDVLARYLDVASAHTFDDLPNKTGDSIDEDVRRLLMTIIDVRQTDPAVIDLTNPDITIPVVRVVAEGLRDQRVSRW